MGPPLLAHRALTQEPGEPPWGLGETSLPWAWGRSVVGEGYPEPAFDLRVKSPKPHGLELWVLSLCHE